MSVITTKLLVVTDPLLLVLPFESIILVYIYAHKYTRTGCRV
jgi:hypothetical protein